MLGVDAGALALGGSCETMQGEAVIDRASCVSFGPSPALTPYVRRVLIIDDVDSVVAQQVPAWCKHYLVVHYGGTVERTVEGRAELVPRTLISGSYTSPFAMRGTGARLSFAAAELTPTGFFSLFGHAAAEICDRVPDVRDLIPARRRHQIVEALAEARTTASRRAIFEHFLTAMVPAGRDRARVAHVRQAVELIQRRHGQLTVSELCSEIGLSHSWMRARFAEVVGLSPKAFIETTRISRAFDQVLSSGTEKVLGSHLAQDLGYYDQAHFIRAFRRYTGFAPSRLPPSAFHLARMFS